MASKATTEVNVLDLFSGIGGFSLGLERAGFKTIAFCEIDPYCRAILKKHWPNVPCYEDITTLNASRCGTGTVTIHEGWTSTDTELGCEPEKEQIRAGREGSRVFSSIDAICGGFPCQDISLAGKGAGIEGERSGLWKEYARIIGEVRPRYVIVENVAALLGRGLSVVLGDLAALGYDAEWHCIPASAVGAPHRRDRLWVIANPHNAGQCADSGDGGGGETSETRDDIGRLCEDVADAECGGFQGGNVECSRPAAIIPSAFGRYCGRGEFGETWRVEPNVGRVAYGIPNTVDRLRALGNAVVPQIPEIIGRAIMERP